MGVVIQARRRRSACEIRPITGTISFKGMDRAGVKRQKLKHIVTGGKVNVEVPKVLIDLTTDEVQVRLSSVRFNEMKKEAVKAANSERREAIEGLVRKDGKEASPTVLQRRINILLEMLYKNKVL